MEHAVVRAEGRSQEIVEQYLAQKGIERNIVLMTPHFLSLPIIISRSDLVATVPHALALYFARLLPDLAVARPPFEIGGFDVKQHWHRRFHSDSRNKWLREQVAQLFNDATDEWQIGDEGGSGPSGRFGAGARAGARVSRKSPGRTSVGRPAGVEAKSVERRTRAAVVKRLAAS